MSHIEESWLEFYSDVSGTLFVLHLQVFTHLQTLLGAHTI